MLLGWGYEQYIHIYEDIPLKCLFLSFWAITILVRPIQMILIIIHVQNQHVGWE